MKNGFTLIELMIVIVIMALLTGGGIVYLNRFNAVQKVETTKDQLITNLRYARNYAVTKQGEDGVLKYVSVDLTSSGLLTVATDVGISFFSKNVSPNGVNTTPINFRFAAADGKLVDNLGVPVDVGVAIVISIGDVGESRVVEVNPSGLINEKK